MLTADEVRRLHQTPFEDVVGEWARLETRLAAQIGIQPARAELGRKDRFYLLVVLLHRRDAFKPWLYARCRDVEREPDGYLDLWAREHYKSTIITFAGAIQEVLRDPDITIGIFSHVRPIAKKFLKQIKRELEANQDLKAAYPDVLYANPGRESPNWSIDSGITVKRRSNAKEATIEAHGLVDGQPTSAHFLLRIYDDVVTLKSVNTPDQVEKTTEAWELSNNLGAAGVDGLSREWMIGTRYSFADTYQTILDRKALKPRIFPATHNGLADGKPVFLSDLAWAQKKLKQSLATIAAQMLQNPAAGAQAMFQKDWLRFTDIRPATLNIYIMVDPANSKKKGSDNTAIAVVGVDAAHNRYLLDGYRHKMSLSERWQALAGLRKVWMNAPGVQMVKVGYERYGMQSDLEHFELEMQRSRDHFEIHELNWVREGEQSKDDRVQRLQPDFKAGKFFLIALTGGETSNQRRMREAGQSFRILQLVKRRDHLGNIYSLNAGFLEEYLTYPFSAKKDLIDATSRLYDMEPVPPIIIDEMDLEPEVYVDGI